MIKDLTPAKVANALGKLRMKLFMDEHDVTLGGIRNINQSPNSFDDVVFALWHEKGVLKGEFFKATTDAGLYYLQNPLRADGTAIMVSGKQYKKVYRLQEAGHKGYKAFRQIAPISFVRDNTKDNYLDLALQANPKNIKSEIILANIHRANSAKPSILVDQWSAGCQVIASPNDFERLLQIGEMQIKAGHGDLFSYALITSKNINL